ncbi:hypothetical protein ACPA9J_05485 [Pseudomonas aeruginosa]
MRQAKGEDWPPELRDKGSRARLHASRKSGFDVLRPDLAAGGPGRRQPARRRMHRTRQRSRNWHGSGQVRRPGDPCPARGAPAPVRLTRRVLRELGLELPGHAAAAAAQVMAKAADPGNRCDAHCLGRAEADDHR